MCGTFLSWYPLFGTKYLVPTNWYQVFGAKYLEPSICTKHLVPSTWFKILGTKFHVLGTTYLVPSTCSGEVLHSKNDVVQMHLGRANHRSPKVPGEEVWTTVWTRPIYHIWKDQNPRNRTAGKNTYGSEQANNLIANLHDLFFLL